MGRLSSTRAIISVGFAPSADQTSADQTSADQTSADAAHSR